MQWYIIPSGYGDSSSVRIDSIIVMDIKLMQGNQTDLGKCS